MTSDELIALFEKFEDEYLNFDSVENPPTKCRDLCAFLTLDRLVPSDDAYDIVDGAEHDQIYLATDIDKLAQVATEQDILLLVRCGVDYDDEVEALTMNA